MIPQYILHGVLNSGTAPAPVLGFVAHFFGDSITYGHTLTNPTVERFTTVLSQNKGWKEVNYGIVSESMQDASYPSHPVFDKTTIPAKTPDDQYLFIALGVNDELGATNGYAFTTTGFTTKYQDVLNYATGTKGWPASRIVLLSPFYVNGGAVPDATLKDNYRAAVQALAVSNHTVYIDIYTYMKNYPGIDSYLPDFVHPNAAMHTIIANYLFNASYTPQ